MIYILDKDLTNREKVTFMNGILKINEVPPIYVNFFNPIKDIIKREHTNFGAPYIGEDDYITLTNDVNEKSLDYEFINKTSKNFDNLKYILADKLIEKCKKYKKNIIIDGIIHKDIINYILKYIDLNFIIVKNKNNKEDYNNIEDLLMFNIDLNNYKEIEDVSADIKSFQDKYEIKTITIEMIE